MLGTPRRRTPQRITRRGAAPVALVVALGLALLAPAAAGCARESELTELADDPADVTVPGPPPTAPTTDPSEGLTADGNELLADLEALREEDDLCEVLGSDAFAALVDSESDAAALVSSPAGVTRLVALLDGTFAHLAAISPAEVAPSMQVVRDVWTRIASLGVSPAAAEARSAEILAEPEVVAATQNLTTWAALNCPDLLTGPLATPT